MRNSQHGPRLEDWGSSATSLSFQSQLKTSAKLSWQEGILTWSCRVRWDGDGSPRRQTEHTPQRRPHVWRAAQVDEDNRASDPQVKMDIILSSFSKGSSSEVCLPTAPREARINQHATQSSFNKELPRSNPSTRRQAELEDTHSLGRQHKPSLISALLLWLAFKRWDVTYLSKAKLNQTSQEEMLKRIFRHSNLYFLFPPSHLSSENVDTSSHTSNVRDYLCTLSCSTLSKHSDSYISYQLRSKWGISLQSNVCLIDEFPFFSYLFLTNGHSTPTDPVQSAIEANTDYCVSSLPMRRILPTGWGGHTAHWPSVCPRQQTSGHSSPSPAGSDAHTPGPSRSVLYCASARARGKENLKHTKGWIKFKTTFLSLRSLKQHPFSGWLPLIWFILWLFLSTWSRWNLWII